jgi:hypothetical protein
MNRILFVFICLIGMALFVFANTDTHAKSQSEVKVAKQD